MQSVKSVADFAKLQDNSFPLQRRCAEIEPQPQTGGCKVAELARHFGKSPHLLGPEESEPELGHRAHPLPQAGKEAAGRLEQGRSEQLIGGGGKPQTSDSFDDAVWERVAPL